MPNIQKTPGAGMEAIGFGGSCEAMPKAAQQEIERLQEMLRTIAFRTQDAKRDREEGRPVSAYNLASGILGQIGGDVSALTAKSD